MTDNRFLNDMESLKKKSQIEGTGWLLPLLLVVFAAGLILYFVDDAGDHQPVIAPQFMIAYTADTGKTVKPPLIIKTDSTVKRHVQIQLNDTVITALKGSTEYRLALYISSNKTLPNTDKIQRFEFDAIDFKNTTSVLTDSSMRQLQNVAGIIKRYPAVKIRIGCYANDTDNDAANLELSKNRANTVAAGLKMFGVKPAQIVAAEGFGSDNKVKKAGAAEMRIKRTSVIINVIAK